MHPDFRLGDWIVRPRRGYIRRGREKVHIHPKPMAVLKCLAGAAGEVVTRDELFEAVWPGVIVSDDALAQCVLELRKSFGDSARNPRFIMTIPKTGYRLIPPVVPLRSPGPVPRTRFRWAIFGTLLVAAVIFGLYQFAPFADRSVTATDANACRNTIAVLPFVNRSLRPENAYFSDGMHDELLGRLALISGLKVISRTSVERYRGTDKSLPEIANELSVAMILEGSVQSSRDQVRINVQLIEASTDEHLWAESYDRQLSAENIFSIQTEVANRIADSLQVTLTPAEKSRVASVPTQNYEAYEALLQGHRALRSGTPASVDEAIAYYQRALELHPGFAQAYLAMAHAYDTGMEELGIPETEAAQKIVLYVRKALQLDSSLGDAYMHLAWNERRLGHLDEAEDYYRRGIELEPGNSVLLHSYGLTLRMMGRAQEALSYYDKAFGLDPLSPLINESRGSLLRDLGRIGEAEKQYRNALLIDPDFPLTNWGLGTLYWSVGQPERAIEWFENAVQLRPYSDSFRAWLALMYLELGQDRQVQAVIDEAMQVVEHEENDVVLVSELLRIYQGQAVLGLPDGRQFAPRRMHGSLVDLPVRALLNGELQKAFDQYEDSHPGLANSQVEINGINYRDAIYVTYLLKQLGRHEQALKLLEQVEAFVDESQRQRLGIRGYWVSDAQIHVLRDDHPAALEALHTAVDEGWRNLWRFYLKHDPILGALHGNEVYQQIVSRVELDMLNRANVNDWGQSKGTE